MIAFLRVLKSDQLSPDLKSECAARSYVEKIESSSFGIQEFKKSPVGICKFDSDHSVFNVKNTSRSKIYLVKTDAGLYPALKPPRRCDFLLVGEKQILFIEIKRKRKGASKAALPQIISTLNELKDIWSQLAAQGVSVMAVVAKKRNRPLSVSGYQVGQDQLDDLFGGKVKLLEGECAVYSDAQGFEI